MWGVDAPRGQVEALAGYAGPPFLIDFKDGKATIPGDGTQKVAFMHMRDVARFAVAALDLERWQPDSRITGDRLSYKEVVALAEEAMGKKFEITHVPVEQLESVLAGEPDPMTQFFHEFMLAVTNGQLNIEDANLMSIFPNIKPMTAGEFWKTHWGDY